MAEITAIRDPRRGKAHRRANTRPDVSTACGRATYGLTEAIPAQQTAPEDRCRICWPLPAAPTEEPTPHV